MRGERPERIAVLFGIPVTREEFFARAASSAWDHGAGLLANRTVERAFAETYAPVCTAACELITWARAAGVSVYRSAVLADLRHTSKRYDVLILVAHWRGAWVREADLRPGWRARLAGAPPESPLAVLRSVLCPGGIGGPGRDEPTLRDAVAAMNQVIRSRLLLPFLPGGLGAEIAAHSLVIDTLSRDLLDQGFGDALLPGNQLELADGLHAPGAVQEALAKDFGGTIDLSCCTASVLGSYLLLERGESIDVIMGAQLIVPAPQILLLRGALELMQQRRLRYAEARRDLTFGLAERRRAGPV